MGNALSDSSNSIPNKIQFNRKIVLGVGNSVTYKGTYKGQKVAVKRILLNPPKNTEDDENFKIQTKLNHENVLKILIIEDDLDFRNIVLELCTGSLFEIIEKTYKGPPLPPDNEVMFQIVNGLNYIHSKNLVHGNIKPENILISMDGQMKLSEFGFENQVTEEKCYITGLKGTLLWMAPECFPSKRDETNKKRYPERDVFSCGCVFFVFLTRENGRIHPFGDIIDHLQIYANIQEGNSINIARLKLYSPFNELIQKMIQNNPSNRITSEKIKDLLLPISIGNANGATVTSIVNFGQQDVDLLKRYYDICYENYGYLLRKLWIFVSKLINSL